MVVTRLLAWMDRKAEQKIAGMVEAAAVPAIIPRRSTKTTTIAGMVEAAAVPACDRTVLMRYVCTANVLPEYVQAYRDEGWTVVTPAPAEFLPGA